MHLEGILFTIPWMLILLAVLLRSRFLRLPKVRGTALVSLFTIKVMATFALQALYTYYYTDRSTADIYRFFDDGIILHHILGENPTDFFRIMAGWYDKSLGFTEAYFDRMNAWIKPFDTGFYNDNHFMIRVNALLAFLSSGYYEIHGILFSFMAFAGLILLVRSLVSNPQKQLTALLLVTFLPSFQLWCSGGVKETMALAGFGLSLMIIHHTDELARGMRKYGLSLLLGLLILASLKVYFLIALVPAVMVLIIARNRRWETLSSWLMWTVITVSGFALAEGMDLGIVEEVVRKQHDFLNHSAELQPGSYFDMAPLEYSMVAIFKRLPEALFNSLLRPLPWQLHHAPEALMLLENIYLFLILGWFAWSLRTQQVQKSLLYFWMQLALPVLCLIGLTTPVLGAVMRYRAPVIVLLLVAIATSLTWRKNPTTS